MEARFQLFQSDVAGKASCARKRTRGKMAQPRTDRRTTASGLNRKPQRLANNSYHVSGIIQFNWMRSVPARVRFRLRFMGLGRAAKGPEPAVLTMGTTPPFLSVIDGLNGLK